MPVAGDREKVHRGLDRHPDGPVRGIGRLREPQDGAAEIDMADLARPEVVFRHVAVALEGAEPAQHRDAPAGFLEAFAVQGTDRALARVDAAAGQLEFAAGWSCSVTRASRSSRMTP